MKTIFKYFLIITLSSACSDEFLEIIPEDNPTVESFYQNEDQIRQATATLYGRPWFRFNDKFSWTAGDGLAGDIFQTYQDEGQFFFFTFTPTNSVVSNAWASLYAVVTRTNLILSEMPPVAASNGVDESVINEALAEVRFFRGVAYYYLTEYWGDVPIVEDQTTLIGNDNYEVPRNTYKSVLQYIANDFQFGVDNLPDSDEPGRVTSWSAKGMLAKVKLTMASDLSDANSNALFAEAASLAKDIIDNSGYALMENYADLFKPENDNNSESLFALQWISGSFGTGNSRQANFARSSLITGNTEAWGGEKSMTYDFFKTIDAIDGVQDSVVEDLRRSSIYMSMGDHYPEIDQQNGGYTYLIVNEGADGSTLENKAPVCNSLKKYVVGSQDDVGSSVVNQATPLNQYMLRLADVYLIFAEATLASASSTSDGEALNVFNTIRERAGLELKTELTFSDILNERRVEFAAEGINWFDVKRYYYRNPQAALNYLNTQERAYTLELKQPEGLDENDPLSYELEAPVSPVIVSDADMVLPIPENELVANPRLGETPEEWVF